MVSRLVKASAAAISLGLLAAGCSSSDESQDASGGTLLIWADEKRAGPIGDLAAEWGAENGVSVEVAQVNFDTLKDSFVQAAPTGQGPDVMMAPQDIIGELARNGLIAPVDLGTNESGFNPVAVEGFTYEGNTYGVPIQVDNLGLFRNTELAPDQPESIEEMGEVGLAAGSTTPIGLPVTSPNGDPYHAWPFYSAAGGYAIGVDDEGTWDLEDIGVGEEGSLVFAEKWAALGEEGLLKSSFTHDIVLDNFVSGTSPYLITGPWNLETVEENADFDFVIETVPGWEGGSDEAQVFVGAQGMMLSQFSQNPTSAQGFLDAIMTTEFMDSIFAVDRRTPAWTESADKAAQSDPLLGDLNAVGEAQGTPVPNIPEIQVVWAELGFAEARILDGSPPEDTMVEAGEAIVRSIG